MARVCIPGKQCQCPPEYAKCMTVVKLEKLRRSKKRSVR